MKKILFYSLCSLLGFLTSCQDDTITPKPRMYPTTAAYTLNGKNYTATEGVVEGLPEGSFSWFEGTTETNLYAATFTLQTDVHTIYFMLNGNTIPTLIQVGDIFPLTPTTTDIAKPNNGGQIVRQSKVFVFKRGTRNGLVSLGDIDTSKSYFKVTKNNDKVFEGEFEFVYGLPKTDKEAAKVEGIITKGFVSIKKERKQ